MCRFVLAGAQVAQSVEQGTENPRVGSSILSLGTTFFYSDMIFQRQLIHGYLKSRYKRFLCDVILDSGETVTAHCTNTGSMKSCLIPGAEVYLSPSDNPKRKTRFTWEMIKIDGKWVGINTSIPNYLVYEAIVNEKIPQLRGYDSVEREKPYGKKSRIDILLKKEDKLCFVEIKNVTLKEGDFALFPDSPTERGRKHLRELLSMKLSGHRSVIIFLVQRTDVSKFSPAKEIDPDYARLLKEVSLEGVEIIVLNAKVSPTSVEIFRELPVIFNIDQ